MPDVAAVNAPVPLPLTMPVRVTAPVPPFATGSAVPEYEMAIVPLLVTGESATDKNVGTDTPTLVTVPNPAVPSVDSVPPEKVRPDPTVTSAKPFEPLPAKMLVLVPGVVFVSVAVKVPPEKVRLLPMVTFEKPPAPFPYRILLPDVAGA